MLVVPFGRRRHPGRGGRGGRGERPAARAAGRAAVGAGGRRAARARAPGAVGGAGVRVHARRGGWRWCCRRARAPGPGRPIAPPRRSLAASHHRRGRARRSAAGRSGWATRQRAALEALRGGPSRVVSALARRPGCDHAGDAAAREPRPRGARALDRAAAAGPTVRRWWRHARGARPSPPPRSARSDEVVGPHGRAGRRRSPAAAARGHRQRQDRGLPARGRRGARARPHGDRARARDRADAPDRRALRGALRRHRGRPALAGSPPASASTSGRGCARARPGCAWARARRCSPR